MHFVLHAESIKDVSKFMREHRLHVRLLARKQRVVNPRPAHYLDDASLIDEVFTNSMSRYVVMTVHVNVGTRLAIMDY